MPALRPHESPPGPLADFFTALRRMHLRAGEPSTREIARKSQSLSHDTVHRVLSGSALPRWRNVEAVVTALEGDLDQARSLWLAARVAQDGQALPEPVPTPEPVLPAPVTRPPTGTPEVLVVDDHPLFRYGMAQLLAEAGYTVVEASDGEEAAARYREKHPQLVLMDLHMPRMSGFDATGLIMAEDPTARVVILSMDESVESVLRALRAGAAGYLVKDMPPQDLLAMIGQALAGERVFPAGLATAVLGSLQDDAEPDSPALTMREHQVLGLLVGGAPYTEVARRLGMSTSTVRRHAANIAAKFGVANTTAAAAYAVRHGLVD